MGKPKTLEDAMENLAAHMRQKGEDLPKAGTGFDAANMEAKREIYEPAQPAPKQRWRRAIADSKGAERRYPNDND